jgi:hypothetical protein
VFGVEAVQPGGLVGAAYLRLGPLGQADEKGGVRFAGRFRAALELVELLLGELPEGLQHPEPHLLAG